MNLKTLSVIAALAVPFGVPCHADISLPAAFANIRILPGGATYMTYGGFSPDGSLQTDTLTAFDATLTATNQAGTDPQVSSSISFSGSVASQENFSVISQVIYYVAVNGPADQTVPVTITSTGEVSLSSDTLEGGFGASASLQLVEPDISATPIDESIDVSSPSSTSESFDISQVLQLQTNTAYVIDIDANTELTEGGARAGSYTASASVDPTVTLDTTDPAYSLEFSPGLLPSATPEPSALVLASSGLAAIAGLGLRRRSGITTRGPAYCNSCQVCECK